MTEQYLMKFRIQIHEKPHHITGFPKKYLKLNFLNHSKWNQNYYNNFAIEYWVDKGEEQPTKFKRVE